MAMQPGEYTAHALAVEAGVTYAVAQRKLADVPHVRIEGRKKFYRMQDAGPVLFGRAGGNDVLDFEEARNRKLTAEARLAEHELAEKQGVLVRADDIVAELDRRILPARAKLLSLPAKLSPLLDPEQPRRAKDILDRAIGEVLTELAGEVGDGDPGSDAGSPDEA